MTLTVGRRVVVGFALPLALLVVIAAVGYFALQRTALRLSQNDEQGALLLAASSQARAGSRDAEQASRSLSDLRAMPVLQGREAGVDSVVAEIERWRKLTDDVIAVAQRQGL